LKEIQEKSLTKQAICAAALLTSVSKAALVVKSNAPLKTLQGGQSMNPQKVKTLLQEAIQDITDCKWFFSRNPQADFSAAVHICRQFFLGEIPPPLVEALLAKHISPVRPGRSRPRKLKPKQALSFLYRVA